MEEFDKFKELKYLMLWFTLVSLSIGIGIFLKIESASIVYLIIIIVLLIFSYLKSKEAEHYKNQVIKLERDINGKKKKNRFIKWMKENWAYILIFLAVALFTLLILKGVLK